jgi:hypothetical protein
LTSIDAFSKRSLPMTQEGMPMEGAEERWEGFNEFGFPIGLRIEDAARMSDIGLRRWFEQLVTFSTYMEERPDDIPTDISRMSRGEMLAAVDRNPYMFAPMGASKDKPRKGH